MSSIYIPDVLPVLPLPPNQVLYPSLVLSLQVARPDSIALIKQLIRDVGDQRGSKPLIIACVPLKAAGPIVTSSGSKRVTTKDPYVTPPNSDDEIDAPSTKALVRYGSNGSERPTQDKLFEYGTAARILRLERLPSSTSSGSPGFIAVVEGLSRIRLERFTSGPSSPYHEAFFTILPSDPLPPTAQDSLGEFQRLANEFLVTLESSGVRLAPLVSRRLKAFVRGLQLATALVLIDVLFGHLPCIGTITPGSTSTLLPLTYEDKLQLLSLIEPTERFEYASATLLKLNEALAMQRRIGDKVDASLSRRQREFLLLQQLAAIRSELEELAASDPASPLAKLKGKNGLGGSSRAKISGGSAQDDDDDSEENEMAELERRIKEKSWTEEAGRVARKEFKRLKKSPPQGAEHGVIRNYLDWLLALPWNESTELALSSDFIAKARKQLDDDHYGLDKIKRRLLEWLAVLKLKQDQWELEKSELDSVSSVSSVNEDLLDSQAETSDMPASPTVSTEANNPVTPVPSPLIQGQRAKPRDKGPILLLCGPPGTGKTSIARSLATAMGRKFHRISLGGVRDEAEIRGHRRTYVAALPGAIASALRKTGVNNPVILLDEIDKLGLNSSHGDPAAALLEVLDPEQNSNFVDHYLGVPLDLSSVLFIATANSLETISDPLYDRMEVIELSGYVHEEKLHIARRYLIPKQLKANALTPELFDMTDEALLHLITSYTREAGVRTVERELGAVVRAKAVEYSESRSAISKADNSAKVTYSNLVTKEDVIKYLGVEKYDPESMDRANTIGVATGMAYQGSGNGGILYIETTKMPGKGDFRTTGNLGDVISESANLAFVWVRAHAYELGIASSRTEDVFQNINVHLHMPSGATPKDGPSAGVAFVVAIVSLMRGIPVKEALSMTGEITLRGNVTPVGGIKEKVLASHRAGIKTIVLPLRNRKDVEADLPQSARADLTFIYARTIIDALEAAFGARLWDGPARERGGFLESRL